MTAPVGRKNGRYATQIGGKHTAPGVTTVLNVLNKPGLPWGAARETAIFAVHHHDQWANLSPDDACERLRKHHRGVWDAKADLGTAVHDLALGWARGQTVDCPPACEPYLVCLERFYSDWKPTTIEAERSVIFEHPDLGYGGSFDLIAEVRGHQRLLIDYKTGDRVWPEGRAQLAAYRNARHLGVYDTDGQLAAIEPMIPVDGCAVLHLRDDGTYALIPVDAGRAEWDFFLTCRRVWAVWSRWDRDKTWPPAPLAVPELMEVVA